jgi:hypothetical protein
MKAAYVQSLLPFLPGINDNVNTTLYLNGLQAETGFRFAGAGSYSFYVAAPGIRENLFPRKKDDFHYQDRYNKATLTPAFPDHLVIFKM